MSRLQELISQLCPNGVEYKSLGELATDIYRGSGIKRDEVTEIGTPCVRYGEIYTTYGIWFEECVSHTIEENISNKKYFEHGDILFAITGESVKEIAKSCAYIGNEKCLAGGDIVVLKHNQDAKYLSYALSTTEAQVQKSRGKVKSKVVHSSVPAIKEIVVPIPPLEVQREIVRILDKFTLLIAELTAELTVRKIQYEYYRNKMFSYNKRIPEIILDDVVSITSGKNKERLDEGEFPVFGSTGIIAKTNTAVYNHEQILVARVGANAGYVHLANGQYDVSDNTLIVDVKQGYLLKYVYYMLINMNLNQYAKGGGQPLITAGELKKLFISMPQYEVQKRIVNILEKFDAICTDLNIGLPAEIEARQKQYEYYRDKLLTFKELGE
ncbi:MAG: restriction endonuclease subunit S [Acetatifactor sp.]|nr:restriction endonuclease subunit S [Acetatifactor sp.]